MWQNIRFELVVVECDQNGNTEAEWDTKEAEEPLHFDTDLNLIDNLK